MVLESPRKNVVFFEKKTILTCFIIIFVNYGNSENNL